MIDMINILTTQRRTALVFLPAFSAYAFSRFESQLSGGNERIARLLRRLPGILDVISEINLAVFYFRGVYYSLVRRVLGVKDVCQVFFFGLRKNGHKLKQNFRSHLFPRILIHVLLLTPCWVY